MKVIDLLNKIAKGEEVPKELWYQGRLYKYNEDNNIVYRYTFSNPMQTLGLILMVDSLNDEVKMIEEDREDLVLTGEKNELGFYVFELPPEYKYFQVATLGNKIYLKNGIVKKLEEKEIEKINIHQEYTAKGQLHDYLYYQGNKYAVSLPQKVLADKLNELIDIVNKLNKE